MYSSKMDTLHSMGLLIYHMLHIWHIGTHVIFCVIDMFFLSVYLWADTFTANEVKKQRKIDIINTFDLARFHYKSCFFTFLGGNFCFFYFVCSKSICPKIYGQKMSITQNMEYVPICQICII